MNNLTKYHIRMNMIKEYLGGVCKKCGAIDELQIDHIDPATKSFTISNKAFKSINKLFLEVDKCQLLCKPCHIEKTISEQKTRVHGTPAMYRKESCRCDLCIKANSEYQSKYDTNRVWCKLCKKRYYRKCKIHAPAV